MLDLKPDCFATGTSVQANWLKAHVHKTKESLYQLLRKVPAKIAKRRNWLDLQHRRCNLENNTLESTERGGVKQLLGKIPFVKTPVKVPHAQQNSGRKPAYSKVAVVTGGVAARNRSSS